jgi:hypothetical protein
MEQSVNGSSEYSNNFLTGLFLLVSIEHMNMENALEFFVKDITRHRTPVRHALPNQKFDFAFIFLQIVEYFMQQAVK